MKAKKSLENSGCPEALSTNCIVWTGDNIPCLGISYGDRVSEVICGIANKICNICKDIDVSQLDLSCLINTCGTCPDDRDLKTVLQCLLDNQCSLKELITTSGGGSTDVTIAVNMKCLKIYDAFGNEIPQNLNMALQSLVNEVCTDRTTLVFLQSEIDDLQNQINNLPDPTPYVEPDISTCVTPVPTPTSDSVPLLAQAFCDYRDLVGSTSDINSAISQQCAGLDTTFAATPGWFIGATTGFKSVNNLWIAYCNLLDRVTSIENTCCKVDCDSVIIKFQINDNQNSDGITIDFSSLYGNYIPSIFTDCGSTITITDVDGKNVTYRIIVAQENTSPEYDLSMLNLTKAVTVSIQAKLCSGTMTCQKCLTVEHTVANAACGSCLVTITGATGTCTIFFTTNAHQDYITAGVGDQIYLPMNATLVSYVTNSGDAVPDTTCLVISAAEFNCYQFNWEGPCTSAPLDDTHFDRIYLGINEWALSDTIGWCANPNLLGAEINLLVTPLFVAKYYYVSTINNALRVRVIGTDIPKIRAHNPTGIGEDYLYLVGELTTDCDLPGGWSNVTPNV